VSDFKGQLDRYCEAYGVSRLARVGLLAHYPLFKLMWFSDYGRPVARRIAQGILPLFARYRFAHRVNQKTPEGVRRVRITIPFSRNDFASFMEVIWAQGYQRVLQFGPFESLVDLGANTGMATLFFALCGGIRSALLVEANKDLIPVARANLAGVSDAMIVRLENVCISRRDGGVARFVVSDNHRHSRASGSATDDNSVVADCERVVEVPFRNLRSLLKQHEEIRIDLLKIDVEGAEHEIIDEPNAFASARVLVIEIHGTSAIRETFLQKLAQNYEVVERTADSFAPCEVVLAKRRDDSRDRS
jgi:FkbM family methyltransferase